MNPFTKKLLHDIDNLNEELDDVMLALSRPADEAQPIDRHELWITFDRVQHELGRIQLHLLSLTDNQQALLGVLNDAGVIPKRRAVVRASGAVLSTPTATNSHPVEIVIESDNG